VRLSARVEGGAYSGDGPTTVELTALRREGFIVVGYIPPRDPHPDPD
jgi:hypothetical protein